MKKFRKTLILAGIVAIITSLSAFQKADKDPEKPVNLKILPKNTTHEELENIMKGFNLALGVKCNYCHAAKKNGEKGLDFASDENHHKEIARAMMKMTQKINKKHFNKAYDGVITNINCATCHNGQKEPKSIKINQ